MYFKKVFEVFILFILSFHLVSFSWFYRNIFVILMISCANSNWYGVGRISRQNIEIDPWSVISKQKESPFIAFEFIKEL